MSTMKSHSKNKTGSFRGSKVYQAEEICGVCQPEIQQGGVMMLSRAFQVGPCAHGKLIVTIKGRDWNERRI